MKQKHPVVEYGIILLGTFLIGIAIKNIYDPVNLVTGGASGIAIIVKELFGVPLWLTNTILNVPLFITAYYMMGWQFMKRTLFATAMLSVILYLLPERAIIGNDLFLSAIFGGIITGIGTGLVFMVNCTTGGTDMLAALIQKKLPHYTTAQIMQVLDGLTVLAGASVFGIQAALYAIVSIFCLGKVTDGIIEGLKFSKQAYIISDRYREIAQAVLERMGRGVTSLDAVGMYSGQKKQVLFCVVSRKEIVVLRQIVAEFDTDAFLIVSDAREVFGEGFIEAVR
ncbi:MAG: YitT family protein [Clostridiales bacterium]|nr:YitT family protein [Clostridiales bacterium]